MDDSDSPGRRTDLFASLTEAQQEAVAHLDGPLLILAGPGSGKTRVVTHRIANLLEHGVSPRQILALTFTNKAAEEMRQRVIQLTSCAEVWLGTFHSFCARLLRYHAPLVGLKENFSIFDTDDSSRALKRAIEESELALTHTTPAAVAHAISWAKNQLITPERYQPRAGNVVGAIAQQLYPEYQRRLLEANAVDFDDLLLHVAVLLRENPELRSSLDQRYRYILVDEYQDTNLAQYAIVRALSIEEPNLAVTGDPDQSIYGWRGANLNNILDFEKDFDNVKVVRLEQNFRSTPNILRAADLLIAHNVRRKHKQLFTDRPEGVPVRLVMYPTGRDEADAIAQRMANEIQCGHRRPGDYAVFYRINALTRQMEHALRRFGIPYQIINGLEFYQRKEIKDVLAYLHLINNPANDIAFLRIVNTPTRGIGKKTLERLSQHARRRRLSLLEAARESGLVESVAKRTAAKVAAFVAGYDAMCVEAVGDVRDAIEAVLQHSGYRDWLQHSESEEDFARLANIEELLTAAEEFDRQHFQEDNRLERFLEQSSLVADTDAFEGESERVTLMTLHAAKGLEFPVVYIIAVEDKLLPHERSSDDPHKLEEERRLLFVGMTRAEEELQLSLAQYRSFRGERRTVVASQFLMELPREEMQYSEPSSYDFAPDISFDIDEFADEFANQDIDGEEDEHQQAPPVWSDEEFIQDAPAPYTAAPVIPGVITGAEMLGKDLRQTGRHSDQFERGMYVIHPEYGRGVIVSVSGTGLKRSVKVQFMEDERQRSFYLAHCPLQLATSKT